MKFNVNNIYLKIVLIVMAWIIVLNLISALGSKTLPIIPNTNYDRTFLLIDHWYWFDAGYYLGIASDGYNEHLGENSFNSRVAFFPIYPILGKYFAMLTSINLRLSLLLVNYLLTIGAAIFIYKLAYEITKDEEKSIISLIYFLVFPFTLFLIIPYSEAAFIFFLSGGFYFMLKKNYLLAGLFGMGITASRFIGIIFPFLMLMYFLETNSWQIKKLNWKIIISSLVPFVGIGLFMLYQYYEFKNPLYFYEMQKIWRSNFEPNIIKTIYHALVEIKNNFDYKIFSEFISLVMFGILGVITWFKINKTLAVYVFISLLVPLLTGTIHSMNRFVVALIPCFIVLSYYSKNKVFNFAYMYIAVALQILFAIMFTHGVWVG